MEDNPFSSPGKAQQSPVGTAKSQESVSPLDMVVPTNPFAFISCYTGIFSIICCFLGVVLGPIAIVTGILGLKKWKVQESAYGETTSKIRIFVGIITGSIGTLVGIIALILFVMSMFE